VRRWLASALSEEQANAIVFIASDAASFITGHILNVDGGHSANLPCSGDRDCAREPTVTTIPDQRSIHTKWKEEVQWLT
jgi:hypothetical protein